MHHTPDAAAPPAHSPPRGRYRWRIVALLFFATTINYIDRQVIGILAPQLQAAFAIDELSYGYIITAFQAAYALGLVLMGAGLDRVGTRIGYALAITLWSLAGMAHALARGTMGFALARFGLGLGEAANFPAAVKTVAEWFPKKERAFATGLFNSGSNIGAILAPLLVPFIAVQLGWQWAFILTGALGFGWLLIWWRTYQPPERHPRLSEAERAYILQDQEPPLAQVSWWRILPHRQTLTICLMRFITDPVWWFFLYWLPKFFYQTHGITLDKIGPPLIVIYLVSDLGSIGGGWLSSWWIRRGRSVDFARKATILIAGLMVVPIVFAAQTEALWGAVALISLATAAHQGYAANIFTLVSDIYPKEAVGSMVGLSGMAGAIGGMLVATLVGWLLETTGSYMLIFSLAGSAYLVAWLILRLGIPRIERIAL